MNLLGRLFLLVLTRLFYKSSWSPFEPVTMVFRVWPHDIDANIHLTAARYFSFGDLTRLKWLSANGLVTKLYTNGYRAVVNAQEITYIREFKPFAKVRVEVELMCWDEKYGYHEQRFYCGDRLFAISHTRMAMTYRGKVVSFDAVCETFGLAVENKPETLVISDWKATLKAKREQFS